MVTENMEGSTLGEKVLIKPIWTDAILMHWNRLDDSTQFTFSLRYLQGREVGCFGLWWWMGLLFKVGQNHPEAYYLSLALVHFQQTQSLRVLYNPCPCY